MTDNSDVHELRGGKKIDMRIETIMDYIVRNRWDAEDFDKLFNEIIREFIRPGIDELHPSRLDRRSLTDAGSVAMLMYLRLEFAVTYPEALNWPGSFDHMPDALCAISIFHLHDEDDSTCYSPGRTFNQAVLLALMQYARERSIEIYNQGELRLN